MIRLSSIFASRWLGDGCDCGRCVVNCGECPIALFDGSTQLLNEFLSNFAATAAAANGPPNGDDTDWKGRQPGKHFPGDAACKDRQDWLVLQGCQKFGKLFEWQMVQYSFLRLVEGVKKKKTAMGVDCQVDHLCGVGGSGGLPVGVAGRDQLLATAGDLRLGCLPAMLPIGVVLAAGQPKLNQPDARHRSESAGSMAVGAVGGPVEQFPPSSRKRVSSRDLLGHLAGRCRIHRTERTSRGFLQIDPVDTARCRYRRFPRISHADQQPRMPPCRRSRNIARAECFRWVVVVHCMTVLFSFVSRSKPKTFAVINAEYPACF